MLETISKGNRLGAVMLVVYYIVFLIAYLILRAVAFGKKSDYGFVYTSSPKKASKIVVVTMMVPIIIVISLLSLSRGENDSNTFSWLFVIMLVIGSFITLFLYLRLKPFGSKRHRFQESAPTVLNNQNYLEAKDRVKDKPFEQHLLAKEVQRNTQEVTIWSFWSSFGIMTILSGLLELSTQLIDTRNILGSDLSNHIWICVLGSAVGWFFSGIHYYFLMAYHLNNTSSIAALRKLTQHERDR